MAILVISTLIQSAFYLISIIQWPKRATSYTEKMITEPISIVIAARNEYENLIVLIPKLLSQNYPQFEIIVALDRCSDQSQAYLMTQSSHHENIKYVVIEKTPSGISPKKHALTKAIEITKHEILALTDADCIPQSTNWLSVINQSYQKETQIAIGYSPYLKIPGFLNRFIRYETILTAIQYFTASKAGTTYMGVGRNMSYKKSLFLEADGYGKHKKIHSGDDDLLIGQLANKKNVATYYHKNSFINTHSAHNWQDYFKQKQRHLSVGKYYKQSHQIILTMLGTSQIMFWLTFVILAILKTNLPLLVLCFAIRVPLQHAFFIKGIREIGDNFEYYWILFLDLVHTIFLLVMGPIGFFTKKVKWN